VSREPAAPAALLERRPQSLVITLLGAYVFPDQRTVWSGGLVRLLGELGSSEAAARVALARLTRRELLERVKEGRLVHYRLTPPATALLEEGERRIFSLGRRPRAPRVWTILWHAIPDERRLERGRLARRLRFLGFGSPQDGVWISPHDREREVAGLLEQLRLEGHATILLGRPGRSFTLEAFLGDAWDLDELPGRYRAFVTAFRRYRRVGLDDRQAFLVRTRLAHAFREFPFLDPCLPEDLVPTHGLRARAVGLFHDLYESLAEPAQRHFDAASRAPVP
jgi:phenylacetic acid degradation operon negative regulatory protein